jgi:hypothetical protein
MSSESEQSLVGDSPATGLTCRDNGSNNRIQPQRQQCPPNAPHSHNRPFYMKPPIIVGGRPIPRHDPCCRRQSSGQSEKEGDMKNDLKKNSKQTEKKPAIREKKQDIQKKKRPLEAKRTIKQIVIEVFAANPTIKNADLIAAVKKEYPSSAFNEKHASWYRWQAKKGALAGAPLPIQ